MEDKKANLLKKIPREGFIRVEKPAANLTISSSDKVALIRKANGLFNTGAIEQAAKIFITLNYTDGIVRLGDHYYNEQNYVKALSLFKLAKDEGRISKTAEKMALILRNWIEK